MKANSLWKQGEIVLSKDGKPPKNGRKWARRKVMNSSFYMREIIPEWWNSYQITTLAGYEMWQKADEIHNY